MTDLGRLLIHSPAALRCLAAMDDLDREVFVDRIMLDLKVRELSRRDHTGDAAISERLRRAKAQMAVALDHRPRGGQCRYCGMSLAGMDQRAIYCSDRCRNYGNSQRNRRVEFGVAA